MEKDFSTYRFAYVTKPPSTGNRVAISIKQLEPAQMESDQMAIPMIKPSGPALVNGPPIETNRAAPIAETVSSQPQRLNVCGPTTRDGDQLDMSHTQTPNYGLVTVPLNGTQPE